MKLSAIALLIAAFVAGSAFAQTANWTGATATGSDFLWSTSTNRMPASVPVSTANLNFLNVTNQSITLGTDRSIGGLTTFNAPDPYTFNAGNSIILSTGLASQTFTQSGAGTVSWNNDIQLNGKEMSWNGLGAGPVAFNGVISGTGTSSILSFSVPGTYTLGGSAGNSWAGELRFLNGGSTQSVVLLDKSAGEAYNGSRIIWTNNNRSIVRNLRSHQIGDLTGLTLNSRGIYDLNGFDETVAFINGGIGSVGSEIHLGSGHLTTGAATGYATISGVGGRLTITGTGGGEISGDLPNTYTGLTTIAGSSLVSLRKINSGHVAIPGNLLVADTAVVSIAPSVTEQIANSATVTIEGSGTLATPQFGVETIGAIASNSADALVRLTNGTQFFVGGNNEDSSYAGRWVNNGSLPSTLTKQGTGTLTLNGPADFTGGGLTVDVRAGKLVINSTFNLAAGSLIVRAGASFGGTGTILGGVSLGPGTVLAPGSSPGTIAITGNMLLDTTTMLNYELGTISDLTTVAGNLTLAGVLNVTNSGGFGAGTYTIFDYGGALTNNGLSLGALPAGFDYQILIDAANTSVYLQVTPVPEPASILTACLGCVAVIRLMRRQQGGACCR